MLQVKRCAQSGQHRDIIIMGKPYTSNLRPAVTLLTSDTVADGDYTFLLDDQDGQSLTNILDTLYFVDAGGVITTPSAGTVTVQARAFAQSYWRNLSDNVIDVTADPADRVPPSGLGRAAEIKLTLAGVTGAVGFRGEFIQGMV